MLIKRPRPPIGRLNESSPAVVNSMERPSSVWYTVWLYFKYMVKENTVQDSYDRVRTSNTAPVAQLGSLSNKDGIAYENVT